MKKEVTFMIGKIVAALTLLVAIALASYEVVMAQSPTYTTSPTASASPSAHPSASPVPSGAPKTGYGSMAN